MFSTSLSQEIYLELYQELVYTGFKGEKLWHKIHLSH